MPMHPVYSSAPSSEDLNFFDRVRKHLNNRNQYSEFLKLVNLYTQDLCAPAWLVHKAQGFIGNNPELYKWFKNFVGAEPEDEIIDHAPVPPTGRISLSNCRGLGPSYRLLPKMEQNKPCSGRDQLCQEVLNDEWVSHPTWASEDSGFVAHRKNQYEEGLHRIEEERHDYDTHIGVADRTIQLLEPIAQQLHNLSPDNRVQFQLDATLGGQSQAIPRRAIYKIYGRDKGREVMNHLFTRPYDVVPILLDRLKQKREEWKAAQREWNKVWRIQTNNLFWRSLDHQGAGSKQDKRQFTTKAIQQELLVKDEEQRRQREIAQKIPPPYHLKTVFEDEGVLYDCFTLYLVYATTKAEAQDQPKLPTFVKEFAATFFGLDPDNIRDSFGGQERLVEDDADGESANDEGMSPRPKAIRNKSSNLLRDVFGRRNGRSNKRDGDDSIASESRASSPDVQSAIDDDVPTASAVPTPPADDAQSTRQDRGTWFSIPSEPENGDKLGPNDEYTRKTYNMYANWTNYCFFRLFCLLYERLLKIKNWEPFVHKQVAKEQVEKPADKIGFIEKVPRDFFGETSGETNFYMKMLQKFEAQITDPSQELQTEVEETLRRYYIFFGSTLYHCDKLVSNAVKHAISVVSNDAKDNSWNIWLAFKRDRLRDKTTHTDELTYRKNVEKHARESDIVRVSYVSALPPVEPPTKLIPYRTSTPKKRRSRSCAKPTGPSTASLKPRRSAGKLTSRRWHTTTRPKASTAAPRKCRSRSSVATCQTPGRPRNSPPSNPRTRMWKRACKSGFRSRSIRSGFQRQTTPTCFGGTISPAVRRWHNKMRRESEERNWRGSFWL
jgi:paired amphipathic helix protein Sin3a